MYSGLLIILLSFFFGYAIKLTNKICLEKINVLLSLCVYFILFLMGISLAQLDNIGQHFQTIFYSVTITFVCVFGCNFICLIGIDIFAPWKTKNNNQQQLPSRLKMIIESLQICLALITGFLVGLYPTHLFVYASKISEIVLILLLFMVGIQLRSNGLTLKQILINKVGLTSAIVVLISAFIGGYFSALILDLPLKTGLALASSFGWYSLSGILVTEAHGPLIGSIAFFNDLLRELIAVLLIPSLIYKYRITAVGICGATSMDFTLPILQKGGGSAIVPMAVVQGFILSLLAPILLAIFNY
jgi:uncharacterized membrane protein YbjE (DUF340 family)